MYAAALVGLCIAFLILAILIRWRWRAVKWLRKRNMLFGVQPEETVCPNGHLVHRMCPHQNVVQGFEVEQKDSLDEHLDVLTRKLADKDTGSYEKRNAGVLEGRLRLSKSKIRETQNEIDNLHAIDQDVRMKYKEIMESLRTDLTSNEKDCKKLQEQIEWVSRRRAELRDEVRRGQMLYGEAAAELAINLAELQRGRIVEHRVTDKPNGHYIPAELRQRKGLFLPKASPAASLVIKPPGSPEVSLSTTEATLTN